MRYEFGGATGDPPPAASTPDMVGAVLALVLGPAVTTVDYRTAALERAVEIMVERAAMRREVAQLSCRDARLQVADWIEAPPDCLKSIEIGKLLCWIPTWGPARMQRLLIPRDIPENKVLAFVQSKLGKVPLTPRQRQRIVERLRVASR